MMTEERRDEIRRIIFFGHHKVDIDHIARAAGCSRVTIMREQALMKSEGLLP